ncbi:MAG TPA: PAS domain S-box protein [Gammaproteobacteria bacterium]
MYKSLRVLFIDDSEDDTLLLLREFHKAGYHVEWQRVQSLAALHEALEQGGWELLLIDYNLPGFTCFDVLQVAHQFQLDIPMIAISGTMGEELAVQLMHAGAHDYILKDRVNRLIPAVERELAEMKLRRDKQRVQRDLAESEARFRQLTNSIDEAFWLIDTNNGTVLYVSPSFEQIWERSTDWLAGQGIFQLLEAVHPEDYSHLLSRLMDESWVRINEEYRILRPSGEERWVQTRFFPVHDEDGRVNRLAGVSHDITERKRMQQEMEKMFRVLEQTADAVMVTDNQGIIEYVNPAFENITGYDRNEVLGCKPNILKSGFQEDAFYARVWQVLKSGMPFSDLFINRRKDGELYYESKTITPVRGADGTITHYVSTGKDITQRLLAHERLQNAINYDTVTGLASRILLADRLEQALLEARRRSKRVAVLCIRIGLAELFSDVRERTASEQLLRALAQRLCEVADKAAVARLSPDEFVVMERQCESREQVEQLARAILATFAEPLEAGGYHVFVSPSIGISLFPEDGDTTDQLLQHAASALSQVRQGVQEPYLFYRSDMSQKKGRLTN